MKNVKEDNGSDTALLLTVFDRCFMFDFCRIKHVPSFSFIPPALFSASFIRLQYLCAELVIHYLF